MSRSSRGQIPGEGERAVALQYSPGNGAPVIVASGMGHLAEKIVEVAVESGVPVYEDNSLATVLSQAVSCVWVVTFLRGTGDPGGAVSGNCGDLCLFSQFRPKGP